METIRMIGNVVVVLSVVGFAGSLLMPAVGIASFYKHTMPVTVLSVFIFFVALALTDRAAKLVGRRHSKLRKKTEVLIQQGRYAEAAKGYTSQALKELKKSELSFATYSIYAFEMWVMAQEPDKALNEARNVLWIYINNNGRWLRDESGKYVDDLTSIVSDFFVAGFNSEGAVFAGEVNNQLEKFGLPMRCAVVPVHKNIFPASCTDCGANLSHTPYQDTAQCGYCKAIIYPLNPLSEAKNENANRARTANIIAVNAAADAANRSVRAERRINLPPSKPLENGSPQTFYGNTISYTLPANWKRRSPVILEEYDMFHLPDQNFSLDLGVRVSQKKEGDMMREFNKIIAETPEAKVSLKVLDGDTLGIFSLIKGLKMDRLYWESFSPPNAQGETNLLKFTMSFPAEEFELHKQLISDIYGSFRIRK